MTVVYVVVLPHLMLLDLAGPTEVLRAAERFGAALDLRFIGPAPAVASSVGIALGAIAPLPETLADGAIVLVPGASNSGEDYRRPEALETVRWLARTIGPGQMLCTVCSAAFLASRAGLLDGRQCTTHYSLQQRLAKENRALDVLPDRVFVRSGNVITSAGAASGIDIALYLLQLLFGPAIAAKVAELLVIYYPRAADDPQASPWIAHRAHAHPRIQAAQELVSRNLRRPWTVASLARDLNVSERHLARLFKLHARVSPGAYIRSIRVAASGQMVRHTRLSLEQIATDCGFQSSEQMRRAWKSLGQPLPSALRREAARS